MIVLSHFFTLASTGIINKPIDFKSQPDNTWIENSWILDDNGKYIPNPEICELMPMINNMSKSF